MKAILAIDQGTTSSKVMLMGTDLVSIAEKVTPFEQYFPQAGWVEHDLDQIWKSVQEGISAVTLKAEGKSIIGIGITNQRETICFWDKKSTRPLARAIVWQDRRTASRCEELRKKGFEKKIQEKTGLLLDPYFSSTKIEWALKNIPEVKSAASAGTLAVGTIDSFILAKLTGGVVHATEPSNASRTMLFDIEKKAWDSEILEIFGINQAILPEVRPTFSLFGITKAVNGLPDGIPITGMIGDQQSALLGQACMEEGQAKCTYGTGAFLLMNTGTKVKRSTHRLLSTIAWTKATEATSENKNGLGETTYALEGSAFMAGATFQWLRDGLKIVSQSSEIEALAAKVSTTDGVMFVPAFTGMGAPYWDPNARAVISGLTRGTGREHIALAALEGVAFQNVDILEAMQKDLGGNLASLNVDGGACKNNLLMQIQSDLLGCKLKRPVFIETTSLGAVFAAGLGAGLWASMGDIKKVWKLDKEFSPKIDESARNSRHEEWLKAVEKARS